MEVGSWPGPVAGRLPFPTFAAALDVPPRPAAEGLVPYDPRLDERIKLTQADYVTLDRLIFGLTTRRVWERLAVAAARADAPNAPAAEIARTLRLDPVEAAAMLDTGPTWWDEVRRTLPEEFTGWLDDTPRPPSPPTRTAGSSSPRWTAGRWWRGRGRRSARSTSGRCSSAARTWPDVCYGDVMAAVRITLSVPDELAVRIKTAAGEGTVSGWVVKVIEEYFAEDEELERQFVDWLDAHPVDDEAQRWVDGVMAKVDTRHRAEEPGAEKHDAA